MAKKLTVLVYCLLLGVVFWLVGCGDDDCPSCPECTDCPETVEGNLQASLHYNTRGMEYWYETEQGGFELFTNIDYRSLDCKDCHVEPSDCSTCHAFASDSKIVSAKSMTIDEAKCLACHGRQAAEISFQYSDVHRDAGFDCGDCHTAEEVHGDGSSPNSMLEPGVMTTRCDNSGCHTEVPSNTYHERHGADFECSACHVQSVVTCYNCHFEAEVAGEGKIAYARFRNWRFLLKRDRGDGNEPKVDIGNFQSLKYEGNAFVAMAPFHAHTISRTAITSCNDCHINANVAEYDGTGFLNVVLWDDQQNALVQEATGIIPVPMDWETSFVFEFAHLDSTVEGTRYWSKLEPIDEGRQMLFAEPLDAMPPQFGAEAH